MIYRANLRQIKNQIIYNIIQTMMIVVFHATTVVSRHNIQKTNERKKLSGVDSCLMRELFVFGVLICFHHFNSLGYVLRLTSCLISLPYSYLSEKGLENLNCYVTVKSPSYSIL